MINIALIEKILKVSGEKDENIAKIMDEIGRTLNEKFAKSFIVYVEEHVKDDAEIEKLVGYIERADQITSENIQEYAEWMKKNSDVDFEEFWEKFEIETQDLEKRIIDSVKGKLTDAQKKEVIDFIQGQSEELKKADEEYIKLLEDVGKAAKQQVQDEMSGMDAGSPADVDAAPVIETPKMEVEESEKEHTDKPLFNDPAPSSVEDSTTVDQVLDEPTVQMDESNDQMDTQKDQTQQPSTFEMPQQEQPSQMPQPTQAQGGAFQGFQDITSSMKQYNGTGNDLDTTAVPATSMPTDSAVPTTTDASISTKSTNTPTSMPIPTPVAPNENTSTTGDTSVASDDDDVKVIF